MMRMKSVGCMLLVASMLLSLLSSCSSEQDGSADTKEAIVTAEETRELSPAEQLEARKLISDELPEKDFGGADFMIFSFDASAPMYVNHLATPETETGDIVEDAVYRRNVDVEERFGIKLNVNMDRIYREASAVMQNYILSNDNTYHLFAGHAVYTGGTALNRIFMNWHDIEYVDFDKPWWNSTSVEKLTLNDVAYIVPSYCTSSVVSAAYCMYYNKMIATDLNLENIYDVVNRGDWTFEKMAELVTGAYNDINGNGKTDDEDGFGLAIATLSPSNTFMWALDMDLVSVDDDCNITIEVASERNASIFEAIYNLYFNNPGVISSNASQTYGMEIFLKNKTLLAGGTFLSAYTDLRDFESDYAIIPYPKYDKKQEDYYSMLDGSHAVLAVPKTAQDLDMIGIITEVMTAESWKNVVPAYYDIALKNKGTRDEESIAMLDRIVESVIVDFAYLYDNWQGYAFILQEMLQAKKSSFASEVEKKRTVAEQWYSDLSDIFLEADV